eukprot:4853039-Pleurochrysis_carterae.AAC.1
MHTSGCNNLSHCALASKRKASTQQIDAWQASAHASPSAQNKEFVLMQQTRKALDLYGTSAQNTSFLCDGAKTVDQGGAATKARALTAAITGQLAGKVVQRLNLTLGPMYANARAITPHGTRRCTHTNMHTHKRARPRAIQTCTHTNNSPVNPLKGLTGEKESRRI